MRKNHIINHDIIYAFHIIKFIGPALWNETSNRGSVREGWKGKRGINGHFGRSDNSNSKIHLVEVRVLVILRSQKRWFIKICINLEVKYNFHVFITKIIKLELSRKVYIRVGKLCRNDITI